VTVAKNDPRTFCALLARVLPSELRADVGVGLSHEEALAELEARMPTPKLPVRVIDRGMVRNANRLREARAPAVSTVRTERSSS
jgi:hypothetical protein